MILVTGATGHVGRAVVSRLASLGHDVAAMVRDVQAAAGACPLETPCALRTTRMRLL
ncbi:MAG: NmrA family NAD(P)-binding protein [Xanthobacteraceae bacterium]